MKKLITLLLVLSACGLYAQQNWQLLNTGIPSNFDPKDFASDGNSLYVFGWLRTDGSPRLYKTTDDGNTWNAVTMNFDSSGYKAGAGFIVNDGKMLGCFFKDVNKGFFMGASADGTGWKKSSTGTNPTGDDILTDVVALDKQTLLLSGYIMPGQSGSFIYKSTDNGATWIKLSISGIPGDEDIMYLEKIGDKVFAATQMQDTWRRLYYSADGGENWYRVNGIENYIKVNGIASPDGGQTLYAYCFKEGPDFDDIFCIKVSINSGNSWKDLQFAGLDSVTDNSISDYSSPNFSEAIYHNGAYYVEIKQKIYKSTPDTWPTGIKNAEQNTLNLYPNPANNMINITFDGTQNTVYTISDVQGRALLAGTCESGHDVDISSLAAGVYLIKLNSGSVARFVKE